MSILDGDMIPEDSFGGIISIPTLATTPNTYKLSPAYISGSVIRVRLGIDKLEHKRVLAFSSRSPIER